jgi:2-(1,2-epoxy-1,2-dihydrophenyl)acetyl-CoA isomerase
VTSETTFAEEVRVERRGIPTLAHSIAAFCDAHGASLYHDLDARADYDRETLRLVEPFLPDVVLLDGYLYLVTPALLARFRNRVLNLHFSDLTLRAADGRPRFSRAARGPGRARGRVPARRVRPYTSSTTNWTTARRFARSWSYPVSPLVEELRTQDAVDVFKAYAFAHEQWMMRTASGPVLAAALELIAAGAVNLDTLAAGDVDSNLPWTLDRGGRRGSESGGRMTHIRVDDRGPVRVITIDRPDRFNSMDVETAREFRRAGLQAARDTAIRAVVLRGVPKAFCSGADLKFIRQREPAYGEAFKRDPRVPAQRHLRNPPPPKPFIAAVEGVAAAGGFGIAMACDLVFASTAASFEWAYGRTALTGAESSTFLLPRIIGLRRSMALALLTPRLSAHQALEWGLITAVCNPGELDDQVFAIAQQLAAGPTHAYAVAKELLNEAAGLDRLDLHLDRELQELTRAADGDEVAEGLRAFVEKRPARFAEVVER